MTCRIEYKYWDCFLEYANFKDYLIEYECLCCNKSYQQKFHENSKRKIFRHIQIYYDDIKSILLLRKGVYPYEYMSDWEKFNETSLPEKKDFYRHLNMENITDADYAYAKRLCKGFEKKKFRRLSWSACSKQYIIFSWCIWELWKYVFWKVRIWSCKFFFSFRISMTSSSKNIEVN